MFKAIKIGSSAYVMLEILIELIFIPPGMFSTSLLKIASAYKLNDIGDSIQMCRYLF